MLTHLNILVHILVALMLGLMGLAAGNDASRVLDNYKLIFTVIITHTASMTLTVLTCKCYTTNGVLKTGVSSETLKVSSILGFMFQFP